jgi:FMN phosphatase YigB (HAD superfamily)
MQKRIRNIVFDLGGVLVGLDSQRCVDAFNKIGAHDIAYFVSEHRVESLFFDSEIGNIAQDVFCDRVRELTARHELMDKDIVWAWNELLTRVTEEKLERLLQLNDKYRVFLLSNTNDMHWYKCVNEFFSYKEFSVDSFFERTFLSYEMHLIKPSEDIFKEVLRMGDMEAGETLFIDDSKANCDAANKVGIHTFVNHHDDDWLEYLNAY